MTLILQNSVVFSAFAMASEIFGIAALFWVLIPVGLLGGALLLKFADEE
jgi:cytochrome b6-f complex subunit 7